MPEASDSYLRSRLELQWRVEKYWHSQLAAERWPAAFHDVRNDYGKNIGKNIGKHRGENSVHIRRG